MSYIFQSHQLHPRRCSLGMGLIGPDQPWTKENAGKQLVPRAEPCDTATHKLTKGSEYYVPKKTVEGRVVNDPGCFKTGRIWEANNPGGVRYVEWCCEKKAPLPPRDLTSDEMQQYGERCGLTRNPTTGEVVILQYGEKTPRWVPFDSYVGSTCSNPGITDGGYKLICCPLRDPDRVLKLPDLQFATPTVTPEQALQEQAAIDQAAAERQQQIESQMIEQPSLLERYGLTTFLVLGTIGIGVTAALFKRFKVASKQAKEAKEAAQAIQKNHNWWPPQVVDDLWEGPPLRPGPELELMDLGGDRWEVYWKCPRTGMRDYLGFIEDTGPGRYRYQASSPRGHRGTHQNLNDAATWLAQRAWRVLRGEK